MNSNKSKSTWYLIGRLISKVVIIVLFIKISGCAKHSDALHGDKIENHGDYIIRFTGAKAYNERLQYKIMPLSDPVTLFFPLILERLSPPVVHELITKMSY